MRYISKFNLFSKSILVLASLFFAYGLWIHFFDGLMPIHEWRKADSLSLTYNYYKGESFFQPKTNFILESGNRNSTAEFPIIYFLVAKIWLMFGQYEWVSKVISFLTLFTALALFSNVLNYFFQNNKKTLLFVGIIFSSPVLLFYSETLLPNVYSFAFLLLAGFFLFRFLTTRGSFHILLFTIFLSLALLIKVTALIAVLTFSGATFFYFFFQEKNVFTTHRKTLFLLASSLITSLILSCLWYKYAIRYNEKFGSDLFSTTIRPIWEVDAESRKRIWNIIWKYQFDMLFHHFVLIPSCLIVLFLFIRKKIHAFLAWLIIIGFFGVISYFILWFWVFDVHDYYLIEILYFPLILFFTILHKFDFNQFKLNKYAVLLFSLIIFLHGVSYTQVAFGKDNVITKNTFFVSNFIKETWGYFHWYHGDHLKKLQNQTQEIQKIIKKEDTVLCISDGSPNVQLYTIKRIGYSGYDVFQSPDIKTRIHELINKGADFMLVVGPEPLDSAVLNYTEVEVYAKNNIKVYDLNSYKTKIALKSKE
jgi:hypothetical protein